MGGRLLVDPDYGTSFDGKPVMWPVGFTGVRFKGEVVVLDAAGHVAATTGRDYYISIAPAADPDSDRLMRAIGAYPAAVRCPYPQDFIDCTAVAEGAADSEISRRLCAQLR